MLLDGNIGGASCAFLIDYTKVYNCYMPNECIKSVGDTVTTRLLFLYFQYLSGNLCVCLCANVCGVLHGGDRGHVQTQTLVCTCHSLRLYQQPFNSEGVRLRTSDSFRQRQCWRKSNSQKKVSNNTTTSCSRAAPLHNKQWRIGAQIHLVWLQLT